MGLIDLFAGLGLALLFAALVQQSADRKRLIALEDRVAGLAPPGTPPIGAPAATPVVAPSPATPSARPAAAPATALGNRAAASPPRLRGPRISLLPHVERDAKADTNRPVGPVLARTLAAVGSGVVQRLKQLHAEAELRLQLESRIGSIWTTRVGLIVFAIGTVLLANLHDGGIAPLHKTALMYAGAIVMFLIGAWYEIRFPQFAHPLIAGAFALASFTSFGGYHLRAMECLPLALTLGVMSAAALLSLGYAHRWRSELTAALGIALGIAAACAAAGGADVYALTAIAAVSAIAALLYVRHAWSYLSLLALLMCYGGYAIWAALHRNAALAPASAAAFWVNAAFLVAFFAIFGIADVAWWGRRSRDRTPLAPVPLGISRAVGPCNVAFCSILIAVVDARIAPATYLPTVYFAFAAMLVLLGRLHRRVRNAEYELYPALGVVFALLAAFGRFDAGTLHVALPFAAVAMLLVGHYTRHWSFHVLAHGILALHFLHYWAARATLYPEQGLGALAFLAWTIPVVVYLVKAHLEELWYASGSRSEWATAQTGGPIMAWLGRDFDRGLKRIATRLPYWEAIAGGVMLVHHCVRYYSVGEAAFPLALMLLLLAPFVLWRRSAALVVTSGVVQLGLAAIALDLLQENGAAIPQPWTAWFTAAAALLTVATIALAWPIRAAGLNSRTRNIGFAWLGVALLAALAAALGLGAHMPAHASGLYAAWIAAIALAWMVSELARATTRAVPGFWPKITSVAALLSPIVLWLINYRFVAGQAAGLYWLLPWSALLLGAGMVRRSPTLLFTGVGILAGQCVYTWADYLQRTTEMLGNVQWWYLGVVWALALAVIWTGPRRFVGAMARYVVLAGQGVILVGIGTAFVVMFSLEPPAVGAYLQWMAVIALIFVAQERARVQGQMFAFGPEIIVTSIFGALAAWGYTSRTFPEPITGVLWLSAFSLALIALAMVRRALGLYAGSFTLLLMTQFELYVYQPVLDAGSVTPARTLVVVALMLAAALVQEGAVRLAGDHLARSHRLSLHTLSALPLTLALYLFARFLESSVTYPWALPVFAATALLLFAATRPFGFPVSAIASVGLMGAGALLFFRYLWSLAPGAIEPAVSTFLFLAAYVVYERLVAAERGLGLPWRVGPLRIEEAVRIGLTQLVLAVAVYAIYRSPLYGTAHEWVTLGWATLGAALMVCGFVFESALYRRCALAVFALGLGRIFLVDTRLMGDVEKTVTFLSLAVCLIAVGWLYSRFAPRVVHQL